MGGRLTAEMPRFAMGAAKDSATLMNEGTHVNQAGMVPFVSTMSVFASMRALEQVRKVLL
jgi:transketolase C-terminal domain/subunit